MDDLDVSDLVSSLPIPEKYLLASKQKTSSESTTTSSSPESPERRPEDWVSGTLASGGDTSPRLEFPEFPGYRRRSRNLDSSTCDERRRSLDLGSGSRHTGARSGYYWGSTDTGLHRLSHSSSEGSIEGRTFLDSETLNSTAPPAFWSSDSHHNHRGTRSIDSSPGVPRRFQLDDSRVRTPKQTLSRVRDLLRQVDNSSSQFVSNKRVQEKCLPRSESPRATDPVCRAKTASASPGQHGNIISAGHHSDAASDDGTVQSSDGDSGLSQVTITENKRSNKSSVGKGRGLAGLRSKFKILEDLPKWKFNSYSRKSHKGHDRSSGSVAGGKGKLQFSDSG